MRKTGFTILFILFLISPNIYGQRKEISRKDFGQAYRKAQEASAKLSRKKTYEFKSSTGDETKLELQMKGFEEIEVPDKSHMVIEYFAPSKSNPSGPKISRVIETIIINGIQYDKNRVISDGKEIPVSNEISVDMINGWKRTEVTNSRRESEIIKYPLEEGAKYFLTKNVLLGNKTVTLLEKVFERTLMARDPKTRQLKDVTLINEHRIWITDDGLLLKEERFETNNISYMTEKISQNICVYEYSQNIKIEAPIIETKPRDTKQKPR